MNARLKHMFVNFAALSKVFKFADVEETGYVDVATISTLAVQLLGAQLSESEKETINSKAESKAEKGNGWFGTSFCLQLTPLSFKLLVAAQG